MKGKILNVIKKKWLRSIGLTILLFAIIIAAYIGAYYGIKQLNLPDFDFTTEKIYSITQATKDKLANIDKKIVIYTYKMDEYYNDFVRKYNQVNQNIEIENVEDVTTKPNWKTEYGITGDSSFLMVTSGEKEKMLTTNDFYEVDYSTYQNMDVTEEAITNAILDVTTEKKPKVYFVKSNNLYGSEYFTGLKNSLTSESNEVEDLDLLTVKSIPEDCQLLVITTLKTDFAEGESKLILDYIKKGGNLLLLIEPNLNQIKTPNFNKILEEYGCSMDEGVILEADTSKMVAGSSSIVISNVSPSAQIIKGINMDINLCVMVPGRINIEASDKLEEKKVKEEIIATVSSKAFYRENIQEQKLDRTSSDKDAANAVIAASFEKTIDEEHTSKMVIFSNTVFATDIQPLGSGYKSALGLYNNEDILINSVSYLTNRGENITIRKTPENVTTFDMTQQQMYTVLAIIFTIPAIIIIIGILVWIKRRRKK